MQSKSTSIGYLALNPERELSLCSHHGDREVIYTCNDCDGMMACSECVTSIHQGHSLYKLKNTATATWEKLIHGYISKAEKLEIPKILKEMKIANGRMDANRKQFQELVAEIQGRGEALKQEIDKITMKMVEAVTKAAKDNADCLSDYKKEINGLYADLVYIVQKCKQAHESGEYKVVFEFEKEIRSGLKLPKVPITQATTFSSNPPTVANPSLEHLVGSVNIAGRRKFELPQQTKSKSSMMSKKGNLVAEFRNLSEITSMLPTSDLTWISNCDTKDIVQIDQMGEEKRKIELDVHVSDISISPDTGNLWFSSGYDYSIREMKNLNMSTVKFHVPSMPLALCITPDNRVAVASFRKVSIYTQTGEELFSTTELKDRDQQISSPRHIRACPLSGNIAVVDWDEQSHGGTGKPCITVLTPTLQTLFKFRKNFHGKNGHKTKQSPGFLPYDVCFDTAGNLFVADNSGRSILMVSNRGEYLRTLNTDPEFGPLTVGVQTGGFLWIGYNYGIVKVLRYSV